VRRHGRGATRKLWFFLGVCFALMRVLGKNTEPIFSYAPLAAPCLKSNTMAAPLRTLSNNYSDCTLIRAEPENAESPFVVTQLGADPMDPTFRQAVFFLQRHGCWIEECANACRPEAERFQIVFDSLEEVMNVLGGLTGKPDIERCEVSVEALSAYIERLRSTTTEEIVRSFLASYRSTKG
jgi:hypothetical protein